MMKALGGRGTLELEFLDGLPAGATLEVVTLGLRGMGPVGI